MWQLGLLQVSHFAVRNAALVLWLLQQGAVDAVSSLLAEHRPPLWPT
jgi:hypothetical protein